MTEAELIKGIVAKLDEMANRAKYDLSTMFAAAEGADDAIRRLRDGHAAGIVSALETAARFIRGAYLFGNPAKAVLQSRNWVENPETADV